MQGKSWLLTLGIAALGGLAVQDAVGTARTAEARTRGESAATRRTYGEPQRLGNGTVRAYVTVDSRDRTIPVELGIAFSEAAMHGLPAPRANAAAHGAHGAHGAPAASGATDAAIATEVLDSHTLLFDLPAPNPTPFQFVQLDWNPGGHEPPGVYDEPHFDFHFWTAPRSVRASIVPSNPDYATLAAALPPEEFRMPFYVDGATAAQMPAGAAAVPLMGLHWLDVRSPELQGLVGHPEKQEKFTKTFIYGSWGGQFIFAEPMITRAHILSKKSSDAAVRDELVPVPTPARAQVPGQHPSAYRISYDAVAKEYRVALTSFAPR